MSVPAAILISARWLVPQRQRAEWFAEWDAELCYIRRACDSRALTFCLGAYKDAWWLRRQSPYRLLDSPLQCLALLAVIAMVSLTGAGRAAFSSPFRETRGLVAMKDAPVARYEAMWKKPGPAFTEVAFYRWVNEPVRTPRGMALYSVVHATGNLFHVLNVPVASSTDGPVLILSRDVWRMDFGDARQIGGHFLDIAGQSVPVAGVIADDAWPLPGRIDAWLLESSTPPHAKGFVVGRLAASGMAPPVFARPARRFREPIAVFAQAMVACLMMAVAALMKFGVARGFRPRAFLLAKAALILPTVYYCGLLAFSVHMPFALIFQFAVFPGGACAFRWAVTDQRRRCPVCLRLLSDTVLLGKASQTFLGWYGTEQMCAQGHGVLRVPELATSCSGSQQWVNLEELYAKVSG